MKKEVNLLKMFLIVPIVIVAVLSFFHYVEGKNWFGETYEIIFTDVKWIVLVTSVIEIVLLFFENRWINDLYKVMTVITFLVTLLCPIYLMAHFNVDGDVSYFQHNSLGIVTLVISLIPYVGFKIYEKVKKRISRSV